MVTLYHVPETYTTKEALLENAVIDAVSVCVWNSAHAECAIAALDAGKHVFYVKNQRQRLLRMLKQCKRQLKRMIGS